MVLLLVYVDAGLDLGVLFFVLFSCRFFFQSMMGRLRVF